MLRFIIMILISLTAGLYLPSCNSNKIACPTYADSFPEKKAKPKTKPDIPKATKTKSGILPPNAKKK
ncbi:MAG: hypothetical protein IPP77_12035 [Bacteroidetes bacterium]|nr:hypothetical protein [Bacteroidota bacterium]